MMPGTADATSDASKPAGPAVIAVSGLDFEAAIAAGPGVATLCGVGSARLAARLETLALQGCRGIISFGTAGGLDPSLAPGTCVLAERIVSESGTLTVDADWLGALRSCLPDAQLGALAGVDQPLMSASDKQRLWLESGARAVDMESHHAALIAHRLGLPFVACRVIVDPAQRSLPSSATVGLRDDGSTAFMPILKALAGHPGQLPALIQLAFDAGAARRTLRTARSRLGNAFALPA